MKNVYSVIYCKSNEGYEYVVIYEDVTTIDIKDGALLITCREGEKDELYVIYAAGAWTKVEGKIIPEEENAT